MVIGVVFFLLFWVMVCLFIRGLGGLDEMSRRRAPFLILCGELIGAAAFLLLAINSWG
jgi:hypothetical protein